MCKEEIKFKPDGKIRIIYKHGQPYGIRDNTGYLLFFPKVTKYSDQEDRYLKELQESFSLAKIIADNLQPETDE